MTEDDLSNFVKEIQNKIKKSEKKIFSKKVIDEYNNPVNFGTFKRPDSKAEITGPCGDKMKIELKINDDKIINARFWTDGCGATIACGSMLTKMIIGKTLKELNNINCYDLLDALDGLPIEHTHCSILTINTLYQAIQKFKNK